MLHILFFLAYGLAVGTIARWIVPGKEPGGWIVSMLLGVGGSLLGAFVGHELGMVGSAFGTGLLMSLLGAIIVVAIYHGITTRRHAPS